MTFIFLFLNSRATSADISSSSVGSGRGNISTTLTRLPKVLYISANSIPMAPAPTMSKLPGTEGSASMSVLLATSFPSNSSPGNSAGREPVAMTMLAAPISAAPFCPLTETRPCPSSLASPAISSTPWLLKRE